MTEKKVCTHTCACMCAYASTSRSVHMSFSGVCVYSQTVGHMCGRVGMLVCTQIVTSKAGSVCCARTCDIKDMLKISFVMSLPFEVVEGHLI